MRFFSTPVLWLFVIIRIPSFSPRGKGKHNENYPNDLLQPPPWQFCLNKTFWPLSSSSLQQFLEEDVAMNMSFDRETIKKLTPELRSSPASFWRSEFDQLEMVYHCCYLLLSLLFSLLILWSMIITSIALEVVLIQWIMNMILFDISISVFFL